MRICELSELAIRRHLLGARGTKTYTAPQIVETVEALGGSLSSAAGWDSPDGAGRALGFLLEGCWFQIWRTMGLPKVTSHGISPASLRSVNSPNLRRRFLSGFFILPQS
jgi:hypothetical protein